MLHQTSSNKTSEETIELNTEEEAAFLAESLTIKRQFDEINVIETQVADIAHLTQQISENIEGKINAKIKKRGLFLLTT